MPFSSRLLLKRRWNCWYLKIMLLATIVSTKTCVRITPTAMVQALHVKEVVADMQACSRTTTPLAATFDVGGRRGSRALEGRVWAPHSSKARRVRHGWRDIHCRRADATGEISRRPLGRLSRLRRPTMALHKRARARSQRARQGASPRYAKSGRKTSRASPSGSSACG